MTSSAPPRALSRRQGLLHRAGLVLALGAAGGLPVSTAQAADPLPLRVVADANPNFSGIWVDTVNNEIAVGDDRGHSLIVYPRTAVGAAAPLRTIQGLSTGLDFPSSVIVDNGNNELWAVDNDTADRAVVFSRTANGNVAPLRSVDFKALEIRQKRTYGWAVDAVNNEVAGTFQQDGSAVHVFDRVTGEPLRDINGPTTGLGDPKGVFIDTVNNELLVVNEGHFLGAPPQAPAILVYTRTATGNVAPLRAIQGALTGLNGPKQISVDTLNNEMAVSNGPANSISVFNRLAKGNVAPVRTIGGELTGLSNPAGVFIDIVNNEIVVANWGNHSITVYPRLANGDVAPLRTITSSPGGPQVGIGNPGALSVDLTNNEFAVTNCVSHPRIAFFSRLANGQVAPARIIEGQKTRISRSLHGLAIDPVNDEVLVPSTLENAVLAFSREDSGDVAPKRVIQGSLTGIDKPQGIAVDPVNDEIALANEGTISAIPSITIFSRLANGNVAPLRTITSDVLGKPVGVWIDSVNNEIVVGDDGEVASVLIFPRLANGPSVPIRTISGPATMLFKVRQVTVDTANNEILVANQGNRAANPPIFGNVAVFDRLANGDVAPRRFIQHAVNSFVKHPRSLWVDAVNNEIGVGDSKGNDIRVFPRLF